jgi:DNA modification methylase
VSFHPKGKNPGSVSDFWDIPTKGSSDKHYAAYNDSLIEKPIVAGCPKGGIILDPCCGTATTGCRALELGRNFIGFEGSQKFIKIGNKNLAPYLQQTNLFP